MRGEIDPLSASRRPGEGGDRTAPAVRCVGLTKRYGELVAVDRIDLEVRRGECFGLLGPNGAGKTTTVEILEGLTPPDAGTVEVLGMRWGTASDHALRGRLGVQLQETQLPDKLTVDETLRVFRSFYAEGRPVEEAIAMVGLGEKRNARVAKLSGGQRQRLALACALVSDPDVLFLDEPTTGLDPQARLAVWELTTDFRRRGGTVLLTTHSMEEATRLADRVAIMDHGRIIALGTPAELVAALGATQIVEVAVAGEAELGALPGVRSAERTRDGWLLAVASVGEALPALLEILDRQGAPLVSLRTHEPSLEDVFVTLTGRGLRDD